MSLIRFIVVGDIHGDEQDKESVRCFFDHVKDWKPEIRILNGDLWNFNAFRKGASEEERRCSIKDDFEMGWNFMHQFHPTQFLLGNHDVRLWRIWEENKGVVSDYCGQLAKEIKDHCHKHNCRIYPYDSRYGVFKKGSLKVLHGYHHGVSAARAHALVYGSCLFSHIHSIDEAPIPGLDRRVARSIGCVCSLDMDFEAHRTAKLRKAHGWAFGLLNDVTGGYHVYQAEKVDHHWIIPTDFKKYI